MRFLHIADLHIGKRLHEFSLLEDQKYILQQILGIAAREQTDVVLIAGDIYDKPVPPAEAVQVYDRFLTALAAQGQIVFAVSGNHDSAERIAFGAQLMRGQNVYVSPVYDGTVTEISLRDEYGELSVCLLPFLKPAVVRHALERKEYAEDEECPAAGSDVLAQSSDEGSAGDGEQPVADQKASTAPCMETAGMKRAESGTSDAGKEIATHQDAVRAALGRVCIPPDRRSILVAHQFVTGAGRCDSEEVVVGGLDNVDASVFDGFDYVALGHIHSPQSVGRGTVRYAGTPLKYSFSEAGQEKSVTIIDMKEKGNVELRTVPLAPLRDLRKIRGTYEEVMQRSSYLGTNQEDYVQVTLTDEEDIPDGLFKLRLIYPNLMQLEYDNRRTRQNREIDVVSETEQKSETELFYEFYEMQNNQPMSETQREFVQKLIGELRPSAGNGGGR